MKKKEKIIIAAIQAVLLTGIITTNIFAASKTEKCFGIAKAHMNDCGTTHTTCAGSATKDAQHDAYVLVPTGLCKKIVGGVLKPKDDGIKKH